MAPDEIQGQSPTEVAQRLTAALVENTTQLRSVRRRQKFANIAIGMLTVVVLAAVYLFVEVRNTQREACENSNDVRHGLLHVADNLEQMIEGPTTEAEAFINDLRSDFAILEC